MRSVDDLDDGKLEELKAEGWMIELISLNPSYTYWGPHEDYMTGSRKDSWNSPVFQDSWKEFELTLDELNECVNFYFEAKRASKACEACGQEGYNPETRKISDSFYDMQGCFMGGKGSGDARWCHKITLDEVQALVDGNRLWDFTRHTEKDKGWVDNDPPTVIDEALVEKVNAWEKNGMGHDAINRSILVRARATRRGVYGLCPECKGKGHLYTEDKAKLTLILWILHPRKGCSRGWEISNIQKEDTQGILTFLREAAERNFQRFQKAVEFSGAFGK